MHLQQTSIIFPENSLSIALEMQVDIRMISSIHHTVYTIVCQLISDHDAAVAKDAAIHVIEYLAQYLQVQKFSYLL
jgi:ABC-type arginine transport system ATPase subunit